MTQRSGVRRHRLSPAPLGPDLVARARLTDALREIPPGGTCLLSAPRGYGTTTIVSQALARPADLVAWVGLDRLDAGAGRLWAQLVAAVETAQGSALAWAFAPERIEAGYLAAALVESIATGPDLWIVLDGLDPVEHADYLADVDYIVANLPAQARMAVTTHHSPAAVPFAHRPSVTVLDRDNVALRPDEAVAVLEKRAPAMDIEEIDRVVGLADGLTSAVAAAAGYARQHPDRDAATWLAGPAARLILDPWFDSLPEPEQRFLLDTAAVDDLAPGLCDAVRVASDSAAILDALDRHGAYLSAVDEATRRPVSAEPIRWRRHALLTSMLRQRTRGVDVSTVHIRAAHWFQEAGDVDATMTHLLSAGLRDEAGRYLRAHEDDLLASGQAGSALTWYDTLPRDAWGPAALHLLRLGWGRAMSGDRLGAEVVCAQLTAALSVLSARSGSGPAIDDDQPAGSGVDGFSREELVGEVHLLRAQLASHAADAATMLRAAQLAQEGLALPSERNSHQAAPTHVIRAYLWINDVEAARREIDLLSDVPFANDMIREASLGGLRAQCLVAEGRVNDGVLSAERSVAWMHSQGLQPLAIGQFSALIARARASADQDLLDSAVTELEAISDAAQTQARVGDHVHALTVLAGVLALRGDLGTALRHVASGRQALLASCPASTMAIPLNQVEIAVRLASGDLVRAERVLHSLPPSTGRVLLWARLSLARGGAGEARPLEMLRPATPRAAAARHVLLAAFAIGRSTRIAEGHLLKAADISGATGMRLVLAGVRPDLIDVAAGAARREGHDVLADLVDVASALRDRPIHVERGSGTPASAPAPALAPLSAGEIELLALLPARDSNAEIAARLGVSVNTVKTRLQRLYRKLGAGGRDDAIRVARASGLLPLA